MSMQAITQNNSSPKLSFGMAFHMDEATIAKKLGQHVLKEVQKARPQLEELARDVDIFVRPETSFGRLDMSKLRTSVQDITEPGKTFFQKIKADLRSYSLPNAQQFSYTTRENLAEELVKDANRAKKQYLLSK
ncbi:MAG: hypothetical protein A2Y25_00525 [Candidatus Melainabacteria bacterium GWF2_37_15]|nr:MAG: hypothetical protein A2Y25_00525 [Candidatus Melainabacteria bacterium GWF2_37_15]